MKKLMFIISCIISAVLAIDFTVRILHIADTREMQTIAIVLVLILTPLFAFDRYKVALEGVITERLTVVFGAAAIMLFFLGSFIKIMHAPGAGVLLTLAVAATIFAIPLLFFTIYKKSLS